MGYEDSATQQLTERYRDEFPVTENLVYLNHAAVAPLPKRCVEAMRWQADDALRHGSLHWDRWAESWEGIRSATARLVNATPGEIAIVKNTSEGIATVALGFPWQAGDRVVAFREEFPANYYIWKKLEDWKGVRVTWLSCESSLEEIEQAAEGARFLAISFVQYLTGFRADLSAIGAVCRRHGVFFFVDAIQGIGAFPMDVRRMGIHAFAADGHKWMLGPEGNGVLFVAAEWQDRIEPMEFGWTTVAGFADYASRDMTLRKDAGRYECGTLNTITCFGLRASLELILEVGVEAIAEEVTRLTNRIAAEASSRGWEVMGGLKRSSGIICIRKPGEDARLTYARLKREAILTSPRQGWVRCSPHFYVGDAGIDRLFEVFGQES
jgi:selenocysteine lyase/cysteine desulfurase